MAAFQGPRSRYICGFLDGSSKSSDSCVKWRALFLLLPLPDGPDCSDGADCPDGPDRVGLDAPDGPDGDDAERAVLSFPDPLRLAASALSG